jgi:hypothetical protein
MVALVAAAVLAVASAGASASSTRHQTWSNNWQFDTFVAYDTSLVNICPLFPGSPIPASSPTYAFSAANLTDYVKVTLIPASSPPLLRIKGSATVGGVIDASNGTYTVTGGPFKEDRINTDFWIFLGSGPVTISGPGGTVSGEATFLDTSTDFPSAMSFEFTSINSCKLS